METQAEPKTNEKIDSFLGDVCRLRQKHAGCALGVRQVCARCSLDLSRRTYEEYPACAPRVSGVARSTNE